MQYSFVFVDRQPRPLALFLSLTRAPCQLARNSFSLNLFADPHPLTLLTSIFYKKGAGRGPATLTSLSQYLLTSSSPSPLSATLMDLPTSVANTGLTAKAKSFRCNTYKKHGAGARSEAFLFSSTNHCSLTTAHFLLSDRATCQPCRALAWSFGAAPPSWHHRLQRNSRRQFPSLRRAAASQSDCRTLRKLSARRLSQICNRPLAQTISPVRIPDALARPTSHPASPPFLCASYLARQSVFHSRACVRQRQAAHRRTSPSPIRFFRFSPAERHNWNLRTTSRPSTRDKHFGLSSPRFPLRHRHKGCLLQDRPCHTTWPSGCTSSSRRESCCLSPRDSRSRAFRPRPSSRCPRPEYVLPYCGS